MEGVLYFFILVPLLISLYNLIYAPKLARIRRKPQKLVSVIIPARNEEKNIKRCIESVLTQTYGNVEIIVVDDHSEDSTYEIVKNIPKVRLIKNPKLPGGWLGKNWACYNGYKVSKGQYILFIDSDVVLGATVIEDAVGSLETKGFSLVTVFPQLRAETILGQISLHNLMWIVLSFLPLRLVSDNPDPRFNCAIGQFMLFERKSYQEIGGHLRVKDSGIEDLALSSNIKRIRKRVGVVIGKESDVKTIMYGDLKECLFGLGKSFVGFLRQSKFAALLFCFVTVAPFLSSIILLIYFGSYFGVVLILMNYLFVFRLLNIPVIYILSSPIQFLFYIVIIVNSLISKNVYWKGRRI